MPPFMVLRGTPSFIEPKGTPPLGLDLPVHISLFPEEDLKTPLNSGRSGGVDVVIIPTLISMFEKIKIKIESQMAQIRLILANTAMNPTKKIPIKATISVVCVSKMFKSAQTGLLKLGYQPASLECRHFA
ncbi:hypothetical protein TWF281_011354 [Arthrobotrys megalospora]